MVTSKLIVLLCSAILTCYCEESVPKRPTGNTTSHLEKEDGLKPIAATATVQKLAKQVASPEHSLNANAEGQQQHNRRNSDQNLRQGRALDNREQTQPSVRYQGQPQSNPSTYGRPSSIDQYQPQPAYQSNPNNDPRQRGRFDQNENQDSPTRDLSRVPQYGRPVTARDQDYGSQHRVQYRDPSALSRDEQSFKPYSFNYIAETEEGITSHQQAADANGRVSGSYSMLIGDGRKRVVDYIADENGFRANVDTNEPGTSSAENPSHVVYSSSGPRQQGHEFRGASNRLQPQPQQHQPRSGRDSYRTETRVTSSVSGPFRGNYGWTSGTQPNRDQTQFRSGREDVAEAGVDSDEESQTRPQGLQRASRDDFQGMPDANVNSSPYNSYPVRGDRGYQSRPGRPVSRDSQSPNLSVPGRDSRQSSGLPPLGNRMPLNPASSPVDDQNYMPNADRFGRTNPRLQNNPSQANEFAPSARRNAGNEPSYYGWFRPSGRPMEQSPMPGFRSQRDPFAPGAQPDVDSRSVYQPPIRDVNPRPQRQPSRSYSRPNFGDASQNAQPLAGRSSPRSDSYPQGNARPQYNRNEQLRPNTQSTATEYQDSIRMNQIPLNIVQPSFDRSSIPAAEDSAQNSLDIQRPSGRSQYIIPETIAPSGDMPQGYRNYGTYWYHGS